MGRGSSSSRPAISLARTALGAGLLFAACAGHPRDATAQGDPIGPGQGGAATGPRLVVLGTVQDGGLPHAACACSRCDRARREPGARRLVASLALYDPDGETVVLVDATPDVREQLDRVAALRGRKTPGVDRAPVDGVLLTHAHVGHYLGLAYFGFEAIHTRGLAVHCTPAMAEFLRSNAPWSQLVRLENILLREIVPGEVQRITASVSVTAIDVPHRNEFADTVALLFRGPRSTVLYVPDTDSWPAWDPPLLDILQDVDVAILDGTFFSVDELPGRDIASIGHPLITETMDLLQERVRAGTLRVHFTHLNHSNPALDEAGPARRALESRGFHVLGESTSVPL